MSLMTAISGLPRAAKWALGAAVLFAAYFGVVEPVLDLKSELDARADAAQARLTTYQQEGPARTEAAASIQRGQQHFAPSLFPDAADKRAEELGRAVEAVLSDAGIRSRTLRSRSAPMQPGGPLDKVLRATERVERRVVEIQFEGTPEQVSGVLAGLEQRPEVSAVSRLQLDRQPEGRFIRASLSVETWVRVPKGDAR
jgi:hypothetical protein